MKTKRIYNGGTNGLVTSDGANSVTWDENGRQTSQLSSDPNDYILEYDWDNRLRKGKYGKKAAKAKKKLLKMQQCEQEQKKPKDEKTAL